MLTYMYRAALYCPDCAGKIQRNIDLKERGKERGSYPVVWAGDSESYPSGPYENGGGEADTPQHCDACGVFLQNSLTSDGVRYLQEHVEAFETQGIGRADVIHEWTDFYGAISWADNDAPKPTYYECGICGAWHNARWEGDCRQDDARFMLEDLDAKHGPDGWEAIDMEDVDAWRATSSLGQLGSL